jgi:hydrocephalus-inducing protein
MKSTETATRRVVLTNNGKYAARFDFELRRLAKEVFTVEPSSGEIEPGASAECAVVFDVSRTADPNARRLKLVDAPDVVLTISEPEPVEEQAKSAMAAAKARTKKERDAASLLEDAEKKERRRAAARASRRVVVHASVDASFAEYALTPRRGVDFGPHLPGADAAAVGTRAFDVTNHGAFPFEVYAFDYGGRDGDGGGGGGDGDGETLGAPAPPPKPEGDALTIGAFVVRPVGGTIEPGEKLTFECEFAPADDRAFSELLGLHVADRDPRDQPLGVPYELRGESVVPGVAAGDGALASVFEEHEVIDRELDAYLSDGRTFPPSGPRRAVSAVYSRRDGAFSFGAVTAEMEPEPEPPRAEETPEAEGDGEASAGAGDEKAAADAAETAAPLAARAVTANFRIFNPKRVACVVDVALTPLGDGHGDGPFPHVFAPRVRDARHKAARARLRRGGFRAARHPLVRGGVGGFGSRRRGRGAFRAARRGRASARHRRRARVRGPGDGRADCPVRARGGRRADGEACASAERRRARRLRARRRGGLRAARARRPRRRRPVHRRRRRRDARDQARARQGALGAV